MDEGFSDLVLAVEDEAVVLQLVTGALRANGLAVVTATSFAEAAALIQRESFGCVVCDKNLPGADGVELLRQLRATQPHCAFILMTAYASIESAIEALRLGADDYLEKPFPTLELVTERVVRALSRRRLEHDRDLLMSRLASFREELRRKSDEIWQQRTEIQMFNDILEARVRKATTDLRERVLFLSSQLAQREGEAAQRSALQLQAEVRRLLEREEAGPLRGELAALARMIDDHLELLAPREAAAAT